MFRRKYEFKPDRVGSGFFSKLYLTRRQRLQLLKWVLYALVLVALSLVQDVILSRVSFGGATTDLVCMGMLLLCLMLPTDDCAVFAVVCSVLFYFSGSAPGTYAIAYLTGLGIIFDIFRYAYLRKSFGSTFFCAAAALMCYELLVFITGLLLQTTIGERFVYFCLTGAISVAVMPLLYPVFLSIGKIGGESWKE